MNTVFKLLVLLGFLALIGCPSNQGQVEYEIAVKCRAYAALAEKTSEFINEGYLIHIDDGNVIKPLSELLNHEIYSANDIIEGADGFLINKVMNKKGILLTIRDVSRPVNSEVVVIGCSYVMVDLMDVFKVKVIKKNNEWSIVNIEIIAQVEGVPSESQM
jgi:hypothetical protein